MVSITGQQVAAAVRPLPSHLTSGLPISDLLPTDLRPSTSAQEQRGISWRLVWLMMNSQSCEQGFCFYLSNNRPMMRESRLGNGYLPARANRSAAFSHCDGISRQ